MCRDCKRSYKCKKICKEVKRYLRSQGIYSAEWIRPERSPVEREERKKWDRWSRWHEIPISALRRPTPFIA